MFETFATLECRGRPDSIGTGDQSMSTMVTDRRTRRAKIQSTGASAFIIYLSGYTWQNPTAHPCFPVVHSRGLHREETEKSPTADPRLKSSPQIHSVAGSGIGDERAYFWTHSLLPVRGFLERRTVPHNAVFDQYILEVAGLEIQRALFVHRKPFITVKTWQTGCYLDSSVVAYGGELAVEIGGVGGNEKFFQMYWVLAFNDAFLAKKYLISYTWSKIYVFLQVIIAFDYNDMFLSILLCSWLSKKAESGSQKSH